MTRHWIHGRSSLVMTCLLLLLSAASQHAWVDYFCSSDNNSSSTVVVTFFKVGLNCWKNTFVLFIIRLFLAMANDGLSPKPGNQDNAERTTSIGNYSMLLFTVL